MTTATIGPANELTLFTSFPISLHGGDDDDDDDLESSFTNSPSSIIVVSLPIFSLVCLFVFTGINFVGRRASETLNWVQSEKKAQNGDADDWVLERGAGVNICHHYERQ